MDEARLELVRRFGSDPIAWSTLQPGLQYLDTSYGYVAYRRALGIDLTLGPPVCAPQDRPALIERFFARRPTATFFYVEDDLARLAQDVGGWRFRRMGFGVDTVLQLPLPHQLDPRIVSATRKAKRADFHVVEVSATDPGPMLSERLQAITRVALERSTVPSEMAFLNRPLQLHDAGGARRFLLGTGEHAFGYAVLDPAFEDGRVTGYLLNLLRFEPVKLWGVYYATVAALAKRLAAEGVGTLSLGFSPLAEVDTQSGSRLLRPQMRWLARRFAQAAYFRRLKELKDAFPGEKRQRFFVSPVPVLLPTVLAFLRASHVPLGLMARRYVEDALDEKGVHAGPRDG